MSPSTRLELTSADGTVINGRRWSPDNDVRGDILLCHGLAEHMGRYEWVGNELAKRGFRVTGIELRGHGHSRGKRGHVMAWSDYVDDLSAGANAIEGPFFILAHSMGTLVTLDYLRTPSPRVRGAIMTGNLLGVPDDAPRWKMAAGRVLSKVLPKLSLDSELNPDHICTDPAVVQAYVEDPLVFSKISTRWFTEMVKAADRVRAHGPQYKLPCLGMWGEDDRIIPVSRIAPFYRTYGGHVETKSWPGLRHEILNEPSKDQILGVALDWLDRQLAAQ